MTATATDQHTAPTVDVIGLPVTAQRMPDAVARIAGWIERRARAYVCVANVHSLVEARRSRALRRVFETADMVTSDGMPLVWMCRAAGHPESERIYGPDLMLEICAISAARGWRHFLYGSTDAVLATLKSNLEARYPGLSIVGTHSPPFRPLADPETAAIASEINASNADIVWVGLGAPKQEQWMADHRANLTAPVLIGVGAAFDFHAGTKAQAPRWMQRCGLEWLFRMASEPRRLGPRYLITNTLFIGYLLRQMVGRRPVA